MTTDTTDLAPPTNHVFVDFENVHAIDLSIIGNKMVNFILLVGSRQKIDSSLVEKLFEHAASVLLVRLASAGKNALDFILAFYLGRAVAADPTGFFHVVSRDKGFDPLIKHLRGKHIHAYRHDSCDTLTFSAQVKPSASTVPNATIPAAPAKPKAQAKSRPQPSISDERLARVVGHLRKPTSTRPKNRKKLVSYLVAYLGQKITDSEASVIVEALGQSGHLNIDEKDRVTYFLE